MRKVIILKKPMYFVFLLLLVSLIVMVICGNSSLGAAKTAGTKKNLDQKKVVLIIINNTGIDDLTASNTPQLYQLANKTGAVGLMNTRSAGKISAVNNYLTIGTGVKAGGGIWGGLAFNTDENYGLLKAGNVYESRTGVEAPKGGVVNIAIADVSRQSQRYKLAIYPGSLGRSLKEAGFEAGVAGNADTQEQNMNELSYHREAVLIAMDHLGRVPFGNVNRELTINQRRSVGGLRTDYEALLDEAEQLLSKVDFLVVETGDTARVNKFTNFLLDWQIPRKKAAALKEIDKFISKLMKKLDLDQTLLIVASPTPSKQMRLQGNNLTPIIMAGPNIKVGVLTSATTRRHGIVDNTDIAPTIISFMDGKIPFYMTGRPMSGESQPGATRYLAEQLQQILIKAQTRVPALTNYVTATAIVLVLSLLILLLGEKGVRYLKLFQVMLLWTISIPLAMLLSTAFNYSFSATPILVTLAISIVLIGTSTLFKSNYLYPILIISLFTCIALILDTISGANLMQRSLLGYCPIIGARFYGIGNEYMGVLIGSSIIGLALLFDVFNLRGRLSFAAIALLFVFVTVVIGYQAFGANVGGAIAAVVAFVVTFVGISQGRVSLKHFLIVMAIILLVLFGLALLDVFQKGSYSHLGRTIILIQKGGFAEAAKIIQRKIAMNIKGTRYTVWTRILIASVVVFPTLFLRPIGAFAKINKEYPWFAAGQIGSALGAITAFLFNDTGAAVAATIIVFSAVATLYIIIEEQMKRYRLESS